MKTVILFASPRKNGHTARALNEYLSRSDFGEIDMIRAYDITIRPCMGCGACKRGRGCVLADANIVRDIYERIAAADSLIIASPVYFNSVPAPMKCIIDRLQPYYIERFVSKTIKGKKENGTLIMCAGEKERKNTREVLHAQMKFVFDVLGYDLSRFIFIDNTDMQ